MAGLEKILEEIRNENEQVVSSILDEGKKIAQDMIDAKNAELEERKKFFEKKFEKVVKLDTEKGVSAAMSTRKKMVLEEKQKIIKEFLEKSKSYIKDLPKEEYISFFEKIAVSHAHSEDGTIRLNAVDKGRFADELVQRINQKLSENNKGTLKLEDEICSEKTGFVMIYNDVEENCSLEAIFSEKAELLADKINSFLFV